MLRGDMRWFRAWCSVLLISTLIAFWVNTALVHASAARGAQPTPQTDVGFIWVSIQVDSPDGSPTKGTTCRTNPNRIASDAVIVRPDEYETVVSRLCLRPTT